MVWHDVINWDDQDGVDMLLGNLQLVSIFETMDIAWPPPLRFVFRQLRILRLNLDRLMLWKSNDIAIHRIKSLANGVVRGCTLCCR